MSILNKDFNDLQLAILNAIEFIFTITITIFFWIGIELTYFRLTFRIIEFLIPKTMCLKQIINLNTELTRDNVISNPDVNRTILSRMDYLARVTMLIPRSDYTTRLGETQRLHHKITVERNFQNIAYYIYERRRWLSLAKEGTTLNDLRSDFRRLAYHYLTGTYGDLGDLIMGNFELSEQIVEKNRRQKIQGILMTLSKFLFVIIPIILLILYVIFPNKISFVSEIFKSKNNLYYFLVLWFAFNLNIIYKLDIIGQLTRLVTELTKLITALKDLNK